MAKALIITITPSLRITVGNGASTLEEETVVKTGDNAGKSKWSPTDGPYHGTLDDALASLLTHHLDKLTDQQIFDIGRARDEIAAGVQLLRQVSAGRLLATCRKTAAARIMQQVELEQVTAALTSAKERADKAEAKVERLNAEANAVALERSTPDVVD